MKLIFRSFVLFCLMAGVSADQPQASQQQDRATNRNQPEPEQPPPAAFRSPQDRAAEQQRDSEERTHQDLINARIADLTFWLVIVGTIQAIATTLGFLASWRAANVARDTILMTHRPRIHVRDIEVIPTDLFHPKGKAEPRPTDKRGMISITGSFSVVNRGATDARLILIEATIYIGPDLPYRGIDRDRRLRLPTETLKNGRADIVSIGAIEVAAHKIAAVRDGHENVFVIGRLLYADGKGTTRRTKFTRKLDIFNGRFYAPKEEPDYEYAD